MGFSTGHRANERNISMLRSRGSAFIKKQSIRLKKNIFNASKFLVKNKKNEPTKYRSNYLVIILKTFAVLCISTFIFLLVILVFRYVFS